MLFTPPDPLTLFAPTIFVRAAAAGFVLLLPGLLWVWRFPTSDDSDVLSQMSRATAFALGWNALLAEGAAWLPIPVTVFPLLLLATAILMLLPHPSHPRRRWSGVMSATGAIGALLVWRFFQVRGVVLPPWVDPIHHTLIVRQIMTLGRVPFSLAPLLDVPFYYHFGFHLNAAYLGWLGGLSPVQATFILGTTVNATVALGLYRLTQAIWPGRSTLSAWVALLLSGWMMRMPAYYATWGRYTLLTGLTVALGLLAHLARARRRTPQPIEMAVLTGGTLLSHYFAGLLVALALGWLVATTVPAGWAATIRRWRKPWIGMSIGLVLALPWLARMWRFAHRYSGLSLPGGNGATGFARQPSYLWQLLSPQGDHLLYLLALASLGWLLRHRRVRPWALWALSLLALSLPWSPAIRPFRPDHFVIVLFVPAVLFLSGAVREVLRFPLHAWRRTLRIIALMIIGGCFGFYGLKGTARIVNPATDFVTAADLNAIRWAATHLPAEARVLLNTAPWQGGSYRGLDGGWWLLPLTGRYTFPPPVIITFGVPDDVRRVAGDAKRLSTLTTCNATFWEIVQRQGITHLYLRRGVGSLQADALAGCQGLKVLYQQDGVSILQLQRKW